MVRLIVVGWLACAVLCAVFTFIGVRADEAARTSEFRRRIQATAALGSKSIDKDAIYRLWGRAAEAPTDALVKEVHASADYGRAYHQLNDIRNTDKDLIKYVYVLRAIDGQRPRFLVDADVLNAKPPPPSQLSYFGRPFENENIERLKAALEKCELQIERDFVPDPEYGVRSLSAYAPIRGPGGVCIGILGVDMADTDMRHAIADARKRAWLSSVLVMIAMFVAMLATVRFAQKPWLRLAKRVMDLAKPYHKADEPALPFDERVSKDMLRIEEAWSTPTESVQRHVRDDILKRYGGPLTAIRVRNDVVPEYVKARAPGDAVLQRHEVSHGLVARIGGLAQIESGATSATLRVSKELHGKFVELATAKQLLCAVTTGGSFLVISTGDIAPLMTLALEMVSVGRSCAAAAKLPISTVIGIDSGSVVVHVTPAGVLLDAWGDSLIGASHLQGAAPPDRILLSAASQQHNQAVPARAHRHADSGQAEIFIVETRNSQRISQETINAAQDNGQRS